MAQTLPPLHESIFGQDDTGFSFCCQNTKQKYNFVLPFPFEFEEYHRRPFKKLFLDAIHHNYVAGRVKSEHE